MKTIDEKRDMSHRVHISFLYIYVCTYLGWKIHGFTGFYSEKLYNTRVSHSGLTGQMIGSTRESNGE